MRQRATLRAASIGLGFWLSLLLLFPPIPPPLPAAGGAETTTESALGRAEGLIGAKHYNEASRVLTETARRDPEAFTRVSELMDRIRQARLEYNRMYAEVVQTLTEGGEERARALIEELKAVDPGGDFGTVLAVEKARAAAELVGRRNEFNRRMDDATLSLGERLYARAAGGYLDALDYLSHGFKPFPAGNIDDNALRQALAAIRDNARELPAAADDLDARAAGFREGTAGPVPEALPEAVGGLLADLGRLGQRRDAIERAAAVIEAQNGRQREAGGAIDEFRLLAAFVVRGRDGSGRQEGLLRAIDLPREAWLADLEGGTARTAQALSQAGREAFDRRSWDESATAFRRASAAWTALAQVLSVRAGAELPLTGDLPEGIAAESAALRSALASRLGSHLPLFLEARERVAEAAARPSLAAQARFLAERAGAVYPTVEAFGAARDELSKRMAAIGQTRADWMGREQWLISWGPQVYDVTAALEVARKTAAAAEALAEACRQEDARLAAAARAEKVRLALLEADARLAELTRGSEEAQMRLADAAGAAEGVVDPRTGLLERDPGRALEILQPLEAEVGHLGGRADEILKRWGSGDEPFQAEPRIRLKQEELARLRIRIAALEAQRAATLETAREYVALAHRYRAEGVRLAGQAGDGVRKGDFDGAGQRVKDAAEAFRLSLSFQEDAAVRRLHDRDLLDLANEIASARREKDRALYIALRDEGMKLFEARKYPEAERKVLEAAMVRAKIFDDPGEIPLLLERIRRAIQFSIEAEVQEVEATYLSIVRFYDYALTEFEKGRKLGKDTRSGKAALESAKATVDAILKTFPFYFKAAKLDLQITQLRNPPAFNQQVRDLLNRARQDLTTNRDSARRDLNLYLEFQPKDAQARKMLDDLVRVQVAPVVAAGSERTGTSAKVIAAARALVARTRTPVDEVARVQLEAARDNLARIEGNRAAADVRDSILLLLGETHRVVKWTAEVESRFRLAEDFYVGGNYLQAQIIVVDLLKDPKIRNDREVLDLKRRIEQKI